MLPGRCSFVFAALVLLASSGCFAELSGGYYPVVNGGSRVEEKGAYGFGFHVGIALKVRQIRASLGRGGDVVAADYEDPTGTGKVGHLAGLWSARIDTMLARLSEPSADGYENWLDLSVGGAWGHGAGSVEYDKSVMIPNSSKRNIGHYGSTWSAYAGPSLHFAMGQQGDILLTAAPAIHNSRIASHDPFRAYGGQVRIVISLGVNPPSADFGDIGLFKLMRSGGSAGGSGLDSDLSDHNKKQGERNDRRREEQDRQKKEKERKKLEGGN